MEKVMLYAIYRVNGKTFVRQVETVEQAEKVLSKAWKCYGELQETNISATIPKECYR